MISGLLDEGGDVWVSLDGSTVPGTGTGPDPTHTHTEIIHCENPIRHTKEKQTPSHRNALIK